MANAVVGALRVALGLDTAKFTTGSKRAKSEASSLAASMQASFKQVQAAATVMAAAVTAATAAISFAVRGAANSMDDLSKASQRVGTTTQELGKLQYAAGLAGVSNEKLQTSLVRLNVAISAIGQRGAPVAARELQRLGISAGGTTLDAMTKLADRFAAMPDGVEKSALAVKVFGRSGAELIPLLNSGGDGLRKMADEAERFGLIVDGRTARAAEAFNDNLSRLGLLVDGAKMQFTAGLIPALSAYTDALLANAGVSKGWLSVGQAVGNMLISISERSANAINNMVGLGLSMIAVKDAAAELVTGGGLAGARAVMDRLNDTLTFRRKYTEALVAGMRADMAAFVAPELAATAGGGSLSEGGGAIGQAVKASKDWRAEIDAILAQSRQLSASFRETAEVIQGSLLSGTRELLPTNDLGVMLAGLDRLKVDVPDLRTNWQRVGDTIVSFADRIEGTLAQAVIQSGNIGKALVNSFKAAAVEAAVGGLFDLLLGARNATGGRGGGLLRLIPGFANGTGPQGAPGGLAMVGERGREIVGLPYKAKVWNNRETEAMLSGGGGQSRVVVDVQPSPLFITSVTQVAGNAGASAAVGAMRAQNRQRIPGAL